MSRQGQSYDVFLSHNSKDKKQVLLVSDYLESQGLRTWIDRNSMYGGSSLPDEISAAICYSKVVTFFVGMHGLGIWQKEELGLIRVQQMEAKLELIPVLLPGIDKFPDDPNYLYLKSRRWVSFSSNDISSREDTESLVDLTKSIRMCLSKLAQVELEKLLEEKDEAEQKLKAISQRIDEINPRLLQAELSKERQRVLEWLSSKRNTLVLERYAQRALKSVPNLEVLIHGKRDGFQRFCSDLSTCLEFAFYAFQSRKNSLIEQMSIELLLSEPEFYKGDMAIKAYKEVFSLIENDIPPELDKDTKAEIKKCFTHLEKQTSILLI